jgi:DNA replication protein DnaC
VDRGGRQRLPDRPARHRQEPSRHRVGDQGLPARAPHAVRHRQHWVDRLDGAQHRNSLDDELRKLDRYRLLVIDEIGYLPLERQAANLLFALIARRYERGSIIVTSNRGFEAWGEILGDAIVAAALIDRLVHHATMITTVGTQV